MSGFVLRRIAYPSSTSTTASDINDAGQFVGSYTDGNGGRHGYLYDGQHFVGIDYPSASTLSSSAAGLNEAGLVVGNFIDGSASIGSGRIGNRDFLYDHGTYTPITARFTEDTVTDIGERGEIVGYGLSGLNQRGFVDSGGTLTTLLYPGSSSTVANGINDKGQVVGRYFDGSNHGYLYDNGRYTPLDVPGATSTTVEGVNHEGQFVGSYTDASGTHGFIGVDGIFARIDAPGATSTTADGINDAGRIVGSYTDGSGTHAYSTTHTNDIYRFFDTRTGDHFYTSSASEKQQIQQSIPSYAYEGVAWSTPDRGSDTHDVFRFFDTKTAMHFFTDSTVERDTILGHNAGFVYEGVAFQAYDDAASAATDTVTLERFFNTKTGQHHFAANATEAAGINQGAAGPGWIDEGHAFTVHTPVDGFLFA